MAKKPKAVKERVSIPVPWKSQYDNQFAPGGTCNLTSAAMVMKFFGILGPNYGYSQLEDNLFVHCSRNGRDRHELETIDWVLEQFGLVDKSTYGGSFEDLKAHLRTGNPAIVHGNFTPSGHIIVVCGFDEAKGTWICNDPAGNLRTGDWNGDHVEYPSKWFREKAAPDGKIWMHLVRKK